MHLKTQFSYPAKRGPLSAGFTLIELLVVVLIIGILSSVALPQYTKSVEKARASEAVVNLRALDNAMQLYVMENGTPTPNLDDLTIELPGEKVDDSTIKLKHFTYDIRNLTSLGRGYELVASRNDQSNDGMNYYLYYNHHGSFRCVARKEAAKTICAAMCGGNKMESTTETSGVVGGFTCRIN